MPVTESALAALDQHWAVQAISDDARRQAIEAAKVRLLSATIGRQLALETEAAEARDPKLLDLTVRLAGAFELVAVEDFNLLFTPAVDPDEVNRRDVSQAGSYRAFELQRTLPVPDDPFERVFHVLHLGALAYCSDRWSELRTWIAEHGDALHGPAATDSWEQRLVAHLYEAWVRLLRKDGWSDLEGIAALIAGLRDDQAKYEEEALAGDPAEVRATAFRLVALYHWARATELLGTYMLQGQPSEIDTELDTHFAAAQRAAAASFDPSLDVLLRWLHAGARRMSAGSLWWLAHRVGSRVPPFIESLTKTRGLFELLPPQRAALAEQGLLDPASRAVVVDLPTSGGKTMLAEFRILQALNQFAGSGGWVAYVAPTRALVNQLTRRLRHDLGPIGVQVEQLSSSVEIDAFEDALLENSAEGEANQFDVLVVTPEKLDLVVRGGRIQRPLALLVLDEAHNIEDQERGLRIELLLATVRRDSPQSSFLLLMPFVPNAQDLAQWLDADGGRSISFRTTAWQPNDRVVGMFWTEPEEGAGNWRLSFQSLTTTPNTLTLKGRHQVGGTRPLSPAHSSVKNSLSLQAVAMATVFSERGTSIAMARTIRDCWTMARSAAERLTPLGEMPRVELVQRFLATEISPKFELIELLNKGVAVHHAGLSDEARSLVEWLAEEGDLRVLCATTSVAQGINFPVSSLFLASRNLPSRGSPEMSKRAFWNLAGRAGRIDQDAVGVVGLARGATEDAASAVAQYVSDATEDLVSRLVTMLREIDDRGQLLNLENVIHSDQWTDFRAYVAHLWNEHRDLDRVIAESESALRNTFGFSTLQRSGSEAARRHADALLEVTRGYARALSDNPERATLADATGFAPEGVRAAIVGLNQLEEKLQPDDWMPDRLFGAGKSMLPALVGVMMTIPQLRQSLGDIASEGLDHRRIADISRDWVAGRSIEEIAADYFRGTTEDLTKEITSACRAIYRSLSYAGTWGISALSKMPTAGIDFDSLSESDRRMINNLPAMLYHGVSSEEAVLMRMNAVPRTIAAPLGRKFVEQSATPLERARPSEAREFLRTLTSSEWSQVAPENAAMTGDDYRRVWAQLAGEQAA